MELIRCCNAKCNKVVGEVEHGKVRFKCKHCGTYTTVEINEHTQRAPQHQTDEIKSMVHVPLSMR